MKVTYNFSGDLQGWVNYPAYGGQDSRDQWAWVGANSILSDETAASDRNTYILSAPSSFVSGWPPGNYVIRFVGHNSSTGADASNLFAQIFGTLTDYSGADILNLATHTAIATGDFDISLSFQTNQFWQKIGCAFSIGPPGSVSKVYGSLISIEYEPPIYFSRNFILYDREASAGYTGLTNYRVYNKVKVEDNAGSGIYNDKMENALVPDADGNVEFHLRQAFRGVLSAIAPNLNDASILLLTDRIKRYKNSYGDLHDNLTVPASLTDSLPFWVMMGGIDKFNYPSIDFFLTYLPANKKFLTWAPLKKQVDANQEDYLNFWVYSNTISSFSLKLKAYFDDGTDSTITVATRTPAFYSELYQLPAGPANTGALLIDTSKNLLSYDLWLIDQSSNVISEVRSYVLDQITYPFTKFFMMLNSLGSYEVHRFYGMESEEVPATPNVMQKFLQPDYSPTDGEFDIINPSIQPKDTYNSGFFDDDTGDLWQEYMRELLLTRKFYNVTDGKRRPMIITSDTIKGKDETNYQRFVSFEARAAFINENFTPLSI